MIVWTLGVVIIGVFAAAPVVEVTGYPWGGVFAPHQEDVSTFRAETVQQYYQNVNGVQESVEVHTSFGPYPGGGCVKKTVEFRNGVKTADRAEPIDCNVAMHIVHDQHLNEINNELTRLGDMMMNYHRFAWF